VIEELPMNLKDYFETSKGMGVLSTADGDGRVNAAVYARPHVMEDGTLGFIMRDRLSHHNLQTNPHAAYLFKEEGPGYQGIRLHLTKAHEEKNTPMVKELCRRCRIDDNPGSVRYLVVFSVVKVLPLIGAGESTD
jgi:hypothetical protein